MPAAAQSARWVSVGEAVLSGGAEVVVAVGRDEAVVVDEIVELVDRDTTASVVVVVDSSDVLVVSLDDVEDPATAVSSLLALHADRTSAPEASNASTRRGLGIPARRRTPGSRNGWRMRMSFFSRIRSDVAVPAVLVLQHGCVCDDGMVLQRNPVSSQSTEAPHRPARPARAEADTTL